jgi:hypothetical protein
MTSLEIQYAIHALRLQLQPEQLVQLVPDVRFHGNIISQRYELGTSYRLL